MTTTQLLTLARQIEVELRTTYTAYALTDPPRAQVLLRQAVHADGIVAALEALPKEPEPAETSGAKYRMLEEGEIIQEGDECRDHNGLDWYPARCSVGMLLHHMDVGYYRRTIIPADEFQVLTEFHQKAVGEQKEEA